MSEGLPEGWAVAEIEDVLTQLSDGRLIHQGWSPRCIPEPSGSNDAWGVLKTTAIQDGFFLEHENKTLPKELDPRPTIEVKPGDILLTCAGPRARCGIACLVERTRPRLMISGKMYRFRTDPEAIETRYLATYLRAPETKIAIDGIKTGMSDSGLNLTHERFRTLPIPVPPLIEQRRIVAKLVRLSARTSAARRHLARVAALAARAKQSILAAAFKGDLTADWREAHGGRLEATTVGAVADASSGYGFPKDRQGKKAGQYPFAKVSDISRAVATSSGRLTTAENFVDDADLRTLRARPVPAGSTVFAKIGEALKLNRRALVQQATILDNNCMALTPRPGRIEPDFLYLFMQTVDLAPFSVATTVPSVRRGDVDSVELNLPSLPEQREIVRRIEAAFARIDRLADESARAARLLDRLDERLLAKAFRGELVPQDPADEPAAALLARLRATRAAAPKRGRRSKEARP